MRRTSPQLLDRTFAILDLFTDDRPERGTTEVARSLGMPTPTAHRILCALREHGFLVQDADTKRFALGSAAIRLGDRARTHAELRGRVAAPLRRLAASTGGTVVLAGIASTRDQAVFLHRSAAAPGVLAHAQPGRRASLHAGATRKALLAFMPENEISDVLAIGLPKLCRATITDPAVLRAHLHQIHERGWSLSFEETELQAWGVAVPICDKGRVVASIGVAGSATGVSRAQLARWLHDVRGVGDELSGDVLRADAAGLAA